MPVAVQATWAVSSFSVQPKGTPGRPSERLCCAETVATSHVWLFKWKLKLIKWKLPQMHEPHLDSSAAQGAPVLGAEGHWPELLTDAHAAGPNDPSGEWRARWNQSSAGGDTRCSNKRVFTLLKVRVMFIFQSHVQFLIQIFHTSITLSRTERFWWPVVSDVNSVFLGLWPQSAAKVSSFSCCKQQNSGHFFFSLNSNPSGSPSPLTHPWFGYQLRQAVTIGHKVGVQRFRLKSHQ